MRRPRPLLIRNDGSPGSSGFALEVVAASSSIIRRETTHSDAYLHLGVPIARKADILGVIEIAQRDVNEDTVQCGYMRFLTQMAEVSIPLAARLQSR